MKNFLKKGVSIFSILTFSAVCFTTPVKTAEAFKFGDVIKVVADDLINDGVNIAGLNKSQNKMLSNLYYSIALLDAASDNVRNAADDSIANKNIITAKEAAMSTLKSNDAGIKMKNGFERTRQDLTKSKEYLHNVLSSGDEEKLRKIDLMIKEANSQRLLSDTMAVAAGLQAVKIIVSTVKAVQNNDKNADTIGQFIVTAKVAQDFLGVRSKISRSINDTTQEYRKARSISDPSKKEQKSAVKAIVPE